MKIRAKAMAVLLAGVIAASATGCGIVKVIPKGQEAQYTGEKKFDATATADKDWDPVVKEITGKAKDLSSVTSNAKTGTSYAVKFSGKVSEYNTDTPKGYIAVTVDGVSDPVQVATGKVVTGTAIRDSQSVKAFQDFTNQTEWSEYAKTLNQASLNNVIKKNNIGKDTVGKTVDVVGCYSPAADGKITVVAVSITVK